MVHILPITWTRAQFQRHNENITSYAQNLIERKLPRGVEVDQEDDSHCWWFLIICLFPKGDSERGEQKLEKMQQELKQTSQEYEPRVGYHQK